MFFDFSVVFNQDFVNKAGEITCKDGFQVLLHVESCERINESFKHVLNRRPIQYHEAKWVLSQRPYVLHGLTFQSPHRLADPARFLREGDLTETDHSKS